MTAKNFAPSLEELIWELWHIQKKVFNKSLYSREMKVHKVKCIILKMLAKIPMLKEMDMLLMVLAKDKRQTFGNSKPRVVQNIISNNNRHIKYGMLTNKTTKKINLL